MAILLKSFGKNGSKQGIHVPTIQVWLREADMERLEALRIFLAKYNNPDHVEGEYAQEYVKEWRVPRRRRPKLTYSYIVRFALEEALDSVKTFLNKHGIEGPSIDGHHGAQ